MMGALWTKDSHADSSESNKQEGKILLDKAWRKRLFGGPHGLGDPEDMHVRHAERDNIIARMVEHKINTDKCAADIATWLECCKKNKGFLVWYWCRPETKAMNACKTRNAGNEQLWAEMTQDYLRRRSEYRRTGVGQQLEYEKGNKRFDKGQVYRESREMDKRYRKFMQAANEENNTSKTGEPS